ncbi:MAG: HEAT repeat domain-containing protein [Anaerolineae bacterium]|nr:HEAT repeat domain-containing protein [Anaerolineae bacterium]
MRADANRARAAGVLLGELRSSEAESRWRAAAGLAQARRVDVVQALGSALSDREPFVRWAAAQSLGEIARQTSEAAIRVAAGQAVLEAAAASDPGTRAAAADAVAAWRDGAPLEPVLTLARDPDATVRAAAVRALGLAGSHAVNVVSRVLQQALDDADAEVRRMAANALAWCRDTSSCSVLRRRLSDPVGTVRAAALRALARLDSRGEVSAALPLLKDADLAVRIEAIRLLRLRGGRECIPALSALKDDPSPAGDATLGALAEAASEEIARRDTPWPLRLLRKRRA